jgi:hypothetical protein
MLKKCELNVITKSKDLCTYIFNITDKSPKRFRFTLVSKIQNLSLSIIEKIYRANEIFIGNNDKAFLTQRRAFQQSALIEIKVLSYIALLAREQGCILPKQFEQISKLSYDCQYLIGAWIKSTIRPTAKLV